VPAFLCVGDVYRRDEIDASHYPVFHQVGFVYVLRVRYPLELFLTYVLSCNGNAATDGGCENLRGR
jgi:phenylalanyl-tRNA synthetase alpha subunit